MKRTRRFLAKAIPPHSTATSDKPWDGPENKTNLKTGQDQAYYEKAYAWRDPDKDETTKAAYKFIHHEVSSDGDVGAANVNGCRTGIESLNGARGGTTIPDADRQGVYDHLAKHLKDAGVEPPELKSARAKKFWEFRSEADETGDITTGELMLYGSIESASPWWGDDPDWNTPRQFKQDLDALGDIKSLNVYINSEGGDVFAGQAIYSILKRHQASVNVYVDGLAASIASIVAMAGDKVVMPSNAMMMIHNPYTLAVGNSNDFRKMADDLDKIRESMLEVYTAKSGLDAKKIGKMMDDESWLTAMDCKNLGFADEIESEKAVAASLNGKILIMNGLKFDLSRFKNQPKLTGIAARGRSKPARNVVNRPDSCIGCDEGDCEGCTCLNCAEDSCMNCPCQECQEDECTGCSCLNCTEDSCTGCSCLECEEDECKGCSCLNCQEDSCTGCSCLECEEDDCDGCKCVGCQKDSCTGCACVNCTGGARASATKEQGDCTGCACYDCAQDACSGQDCPKFTRPPYAKKTPSNEQTDDGLVSLCEAQLKINQNRRISA